MVDLFREIRRVLRDDGTVWLNLGDSYAGAPGGFQGRNGQRATRTFTARMQHRKEGAGLKPKDLIGIPWRVALALQADGWWLRQDIIWSKPNPMPESVTDRCTKSHEYIFLFSKLDRYYYDIDAVREPNSPESLARQQRGRSENHKWADGGPGGQTLATDISGACHPLGRNRRSVWNIATAPFSGAHFATMPPAVAEPCILAGCPKGGVVLDPFGGAGTTGLVAERLERNAILLELNPDYCQIATDRIRADLGRVQTNLSATQKDSGPLFADAAD